MKEKQVSVLKAQGFIKRNSLPLADISSTGTTWKSGWEVVRGWNTAAFSWRRYSHDSKTSAEKWSQEKAAVEALMNAAAADTKVKVYGTTDRGEWGNGYDLHAANPGDTLPEGALNAEQIMERLDDCWKKRIAAEKKYAKSLLEKEAAELRAKLAEIEAKIKALEV